MTKREVFAILSVDGNRADFRHDLGAVRSAKQNHRSAAIHNSGKCGDPERICATLIAQKFFQPSIEAMHAWGRLYRKRMRVLSVEDVGENGDAKNE